VFVSQEPLAWWQTVWEAAVTAAHVPLLGAPAAVLQAWQSVVAPPPQLVSQQTASTQ
jgi:hypothetical protein